MPFFPYQSGQLVELSEELDRWRTVLDQRGPLPRRWTGQLRRDLEAEAVAASVAMEQVPVTVEEVRRILVGERPATVRPQDQDLVRGYRSAMDFVLRRGDDPGFQWNRELVVGLHDRILAGNYATGAGRLATSSRWVANELGTVFAPAPPEAIPELVDQACAYMEAEAAQMHAAVAAGWIHVVTAAIHPFRDGNGRVARVLASLAMYRGGFKRKEFTSLEEWWGRHLGDYHAAFSCLGDTFDPTVDVTPFIEAHARAQLSQVRALDLRQRSERRIWAALETLAESARLQPRVVYALWDAFNGREVASSYYTAVADVSRQTATSDFKALVAAELLMAEGERRWRRYHPAPLLFGRVGEILGLDVPEGEGRSWIVNALTYRLADGVA